MLVDILRVEGRRAESARWMAGDDVGGGSQQLTCQCYADAVSAVPTLQYSCTRIVHYQANGTKVLLKYKCHYWYNLH